MKALKYSDICLIPNFSECSSRSDCDTSVQIGGGRFKLPVMPANMKAVIDESLAHWLSANDYFYIMHRFGFNIANFVLKANEENWKTISISVGVKEEDKNYIRHIRASSLRVDFITIDIAHGYSRGMCDMLRFIREELGKDVCIIAGNVSTPDAVVMLYAWGADYVKVGVGQGAPCTTKDKTGFTMPMFTCIKKCGDCYASRADFNNKARIPIIADGGVRSNGDIAKALAAGADLVMAGSFFAACYDSPCASLNIDGVLHKAYFGSASFENKQATTHIEGILKNITSNGMSVSEKLREVQEDLQSAMSYGGGQDLSCFKQVKYMEI